MDAEAVYFSVDGGQSEWLAGIPNASRSPPTPGPGSGAASAPGSAASGVPSGSGAVAGGSGVGSMHVGEGHPQAQSHIIHGGTDYVVHVAQSAVVLGTNDPTIIMTVPTTAAIVANWIRGEHCILIHYGNTDVEFASIVKLCTQLRLKEQVPVLCSSRTYDAAGSTICIPREDVVGKFMSGESIVVHFVGQSDAIELGQIFARIATSCAQQRGPKEARIDLTKVRFGLLIDTDGGRGIESRILDVATGEQLFMAEYDEDRTKRLTKAGMPTARARRVDSIMTYYKPQVIPSDPPTPSVLQKEWETNAGCHAFRNSIIPPIQDPALVVPVGGFSALLSSSPFGKSGVVGIAILAERGEQLKYLIEYMINVCLGAPTKWISLD